MEGKRVRRPSRALQERADDEDIFDEDEEEDFEHEEEEEDPQDESSSFREEKEPETKKKRRSSSTSAPRGRKSEVVGVERRSSSAPGRRRKATKEVHPASIPAASGICFLDSSAFVNPDIKRKICSYLGRFEITALSMTCKSFRAAIMGSNLKVGGFML